LKSRALTKTAVVVAQAVTLHTLAAAAEAANRSLLTESLLAGRQKVKASYGVPILVP
jgi:precorrin-6B methylase 2